MKNLLPFLFAFAGLAVGGVIGFIAAPSAQAPRPVPAPPAVTPTPAAPLQPPPSEPAAPHATTPIPAPQIDEPAGIGAITGRVTLDGNPLAGVTLRAVPLVETPLPQDATREQRVAAFALRRATERALERSALSGADGRFRLADLDAARLYAITPDKPGYSFSSAYRPAPEFFKVGNEADFTAAASGTIIATVRLPDGREPEQARIAIVPMDRDGRAHNWVWSPGNTQHTIRAGRFALTATVGEHDEFRSARTVLNVMPGAEPQRLDIRLQARPGVMGRFVPVEGMDRGLHVFLIREDQGHFPMPRRTMFYSDSGQVLIASDDFSFQFMDVEPGSYQLAVTHGGAVVLRRDLAISDELKHVELRMTEPDPADYIIVRVATAAGPLNDGVRFTVIRRGEGRSQSGDDVPLPRGDGEFWIARQNLTYTGSVESFGITIHTPNHGERSFTYQRDATHVVEILFHEPAFLNVSVSGLEGHPQRKGMRLAVHRASGPIPAPGGSRGNEPELEASHRHGPLEAGAYQATLYVAGGSGSDVFRLASERCTVQEGENEVTIAVPQLYTFRIHLPEELRGGNRVEVRRADSLDKARVEGERGAAEYTATHLPAGEYLIWKFPVGEMHVSLPAAHNRVIEFQPQAFNGYRLMGRAPLKDHVSPTGLRPGDIVIAMDGNALEDFQHRLRYMQESMNKPETTWTIMRNGARHEVTFNPADYNAAPFRLEATRVE